MTIDEMRELFAYNDWANQRIFDLVAQLPEEQYLRDMKSSHGGIHGTLTHLVGAEKIWLSRWVNNPDKAILHGNDVSSLAELKTTWETVRAGREKFLASATDAKLKEVFVMTTTKGDTFSHTYQQMMQQVISHGSYHRGQVVTLLRQLGVTPTGTDLIAYYRKK